MDRAPDIGRLSRAGAPRGAGAVTPRNWAVVRPEWTAEVGGAVSLVPGVDAVLASAFEGKRAGVLVHRVMRCGDDPVCIAVAMPKGQRTATLIRDSHAFAISMVERASRLMQERLGPGGEGDGLEIFRTRTLATGSPVLVEAVAAMDCEVVRHYDLDGDHEVYVGQVIAGVTRREQALPGRGAGVEAGERGVAGRRESPRRMRAASE